MDRAEIEQNYRIRNGRIVSSCIFEGAAIYAPYFYEMWNYSLADETYGTGPGFYAIFCVRDDDRAAFPEIPANVARILVEEDEDGSVSTWELENDT